MAELAFLVSICPIWPDRLIQTLVIGSIHSDEGLTLETSVFESFTLANLPYQPCG